MQSMVEPRDDSQVFQTRRRPAVPNGVLGMLIFIVTEIMFFAGLVSAFLVAKGAAQTSWPPPGQPRLPVEETALNTVALLASGVVLFFAGRAFGKDEATRARRLLVVSMVLGAVFVGFQGAEWVALIREGLTMTTSTHGSFFYLIVGTHALHAVAALAGLVYVWRRMCRGDLPAPTLWTAQVFWYFVVGVWPILYHQVYLS